MSSSGSWVRCHGCYFGVMGEKGREVVCVDLFRLQRFWCIGGLCLLCSVRFFFINHSRGVLRRDPRVGDSTIVSKSTDRTRELTFRLWVTTYYLFISHAGHPSGRLYEFESTLMSERPRGPLIVFGCMNIFGVRNIGWVVRRQEIHTLQRNISLQ